MRSYNSSVTGTPRTTVPFAARLLAPASSFFVFVVGFGDQRMEAKEGAGIVSDGDAWRIRHHINYAIIANDLHDVTEGSHQRVAGRGGEVGSSVPQSFQ